ncbi:MAG: hypothetical protein QM699_05770 [Amaricoccus sp.]|uniref:hypothetical protein n=1 Tax=Amaricoccus sp. TaxID=1872485 RepID=UPI0039E4763F
MTLSPFARFGLIGLLFGLALAGCEAQPLGSFQSARYMASPTQPDLLLSFAPGGATLAPGEVARLDSYVRGGMLGANDDVVLYVGPSGSRRLDAERLGKLAKVFPATRARVRVVAAPEAAGVEVGPDGVVVRTVSYGKITIECPGNTAGPLELTTPLPEMTCANAFNRATMAANPRDSGRAGRLRRHARGPLGRGGQAAAGRQGALPADGLDGSDGRLTPWHRPPGRA